MTLSVGLVSVLVSSSMYEVSSGGMLFSGSFSKTHACITELMTFSFLSPRPKGSTVTASIGVGSRGAPGAGAPLTYSSF